MTTQQCLRQKKALVFPEEQASEQQSALFMKKLIAVAVSSITYLRAIFPECAFADRCLEDLNLKILKDDTTSAGACQVIKWIKGCFDALDKKYLRTMVVGIYTKPGNPDTVIESYTFKFSYESEGGMDIYRNNEKISEVKPTLETMAACTKKAVIRLMRTLILLTHSLHTLPDDAYMTMKLQYFDEVTPDDYNPPGFEACDNDGFQFEEEPVNIKVGDVNTPFHTLKLRIKTDKRRFETNGADHGVVTQQQIQKTDEDQHMSEIQQVLSTSLHNREGEQRVPDIEGPLEGESVPCQSPAKPASDGNAVSTTGSQQTQESHADNGVRCGCGYNEDDGLMVLCSNCNHWQHGVCYCIIDDTKAPTRHICDMCGNLDDPHLYPTEPHLQEMDKVARKATCLWRRLLKVCQETSRIIVPDLAHRLGIEHCVAHGLLSRLQKEGYVKTTRSKKTGKLVDKEKLQDGLKKYFNEKMEDHASCQLEVPNEIETLTAKAMNMDLSEKKRSDKIHGNQKIEGVNTGGRKRSRVIPVEEYEFGDSQDFDGSQVKKRRSSIAKESVQV